MGCSEGVSPTDMAPNRNASRASASKASAACGDSDANAAFLGCSLNATRSADRRGGEGASAEGATLSLLSVAADGDTDMVVKRDASSSLGSAAL